MIKCRYLGISLFSFLLSTTAAWAQNYDGSGAPNFVPHTLEEALSTAYLTNPELQQERAVLRATDEGVSQAHAGWRPTIQTSLGGSITKGSSVGSSDYNQNGQIVQGADSIQSADGQLGYQAQVSISQPIYQGGKTTAKTHQAVNAVMSERAKLLSTEQKVFQRVVKAYVGVIQAQQLLQININNEKILAEQAKATQQRFNLGEITRTDTAQAEAALADARARRQTADGNLRDAEATYTQVVGIAPPPNLKPPQPLILPVKTEQEAIAIAASNNPDVITALFTEASQKAAVNVAISEIMPKVNANLQYQRMKDQGVGRNQMDSKMGTLQMTMPIYQSGSEYSAIRQAKQQVQAAHRQVSTQRRLATQLASSNWQKFLAAKASIGSNRSAIAANIVALAGVEKQAVVGTSTTLEMLQQQQTLLNSQTTLIQNLGTMVTASYDVAAAMGRLTAQDLKLNVPHYDYTAYYNAVKNRWWGMNDYAQDQPGR
ncbi:Outer membrane protein TolC (TolC) (PDB:1EK9) [Commensalibacter communis]|uniref:Outer membrane protein TolC (TolC) n=1 Tax=Commensalibacter communis TaxID=2972786 RepID=A0A9W4TMA1_9PROT|nr:TolC family outer membrane protein [Commensalibacter communis]CAI3927776.1 Outer membrane protein TolC (TolC) (PDB:1EK9) [Commensalibacter communis]CAI3928338.1 Outer membrane protein TolC (TolC) (PDB:1EK9) [Commensalibacter communis]CAI3933099.1 Outer membrane protein TolC (TolC) (PDB:1EK9) [Commensalibacter communis]CAI3934428.1 Outer membrane protein TolC (TolC) (PDB:1EK9) [Commensalibacter communis]CAI3934642.1 Outer membrane protein TolC (TolC) (PDB:1EK9) [Commensalibacter communis]